MNTTMLLPQLREEVLEANLELVRRGLVLYTFGNASGISREQGLVVIKPSGVPYDEMRREHLVAADRLLQRLGAATGREGCRTGLVFHSLRLDLLLRFADPFGAVQSISENRWRSPHPF